MKAMILIVLIFAATMFSACEDRKNKYQHPGYRSGKVK